jgi:hypothetical protein
MEYIYVYIYIYTHTYIYYRILLSHKEKLNYAICRKMLLSEICKLTWSNIACFCLFLEHIPKMMMMVMIAHEYICIWVTVWEWDNRRGRGK